jgi:hypothetical protein
MILQPEIAPPGAAAGALDADIAERVRECCGEPLAPSADCLRQIARAVEYFVAVEEGHEAVDGRSLAVLTSQALASIGEHGAARRLLVFGSGLMRAAEWEICRGRRMWVLDLRQLEPADGRVLEMALLASLAAVLRGVAGLWDSTAGAGVIGLRGLRTACAAPVQAPGRRAAERRLAEEVAGWCRLLLEREGRSRGWSARPEVLLLDWT